MNVLGVKMYFAMQNAKARFIDFLKKEKGGSEIIAMVLVIAIVLVLAGVFWNEISEFFGNLMSSMLGKNPVDKIDGSSISVSTP